MLNQRDKALVLTAICIMALAPANLLAQGSAERDDEAARLTALLTSAAPVFERAKACQRLAIIGDARAVPALAALLADEQLSNYARAGLEVIADPAAGQALRQAIGRLEGKLLIGVFNSIGQRRDQAASADLVPYLADADAAVASAAARALGHIGTRESAGILRRKLQQASTQRRPAVAQACLLCAQRLLQAADRKGAVDLLDSVRQAELPQHLVLAATQAVILARGEDGLPLLVEQLSSDDEARFRLGLRAARTIQGDVSARLVDLFDKQSPQRQALLLIAIGDLGKPSSLPTVVAAAGEGPSEVRVEALRVLARLGDASALPTLLAGALDSDSRVAQAARSSLARLPGEKVDLAIVGMLRSPDSTKRRVAVELAARRRIAAATPALFELAHGPDSPDRMAAVKALGSTIQLAELPQLLARARSADTAAELEAAREAARSACRRMPQDKCAALLASRLPDADPEVTAFLLEQLGRVGGAAALEAVVEAAREGDAAAQDAATQVLGQWLTADAAPAMFELARSLQSEKLEIRVLRGYVRVARQLEMPLPERLEVCRNALMIADRKDEKTLVLAVLRRHAAPAGLDIASSLLNEPGMKEQACTTIVAIADKLVRTSPAASARVEAALQQVLRTTRNDKLKEQARDLIAQARQASE